MDRSADLHILSQSELFRGLPVEALDEARAAAQRRRLQKGDVLFRQDDAVSTVYLVVAGRLRVSQTTSSGQQIIIRYVGAGETTGYSTVSGRQTHHSTVAAVDDTTLMAWPRARFQEVMARHPQIAVNLLSVIDARYQEMQSRMLELSTESVDRRIAHTVLRLIAQAGRRTADGIEIAFPISRQDIAEMTGTTLHTVSRTVSGWETAGIIDSGRRRMIVRKPESLSSIAAGQEA